MAWNSRPATIICFEQCKALSLQYDLLKNGLYETGLIRHGLQKLAVRINQKYQKGQKKSKLTMVHVHIHIHPAPLE